MLSDKHAKAGLRWGLSSEEPARQCRRHGFDPRSWKIPHAAGQLSPCAATTDACSAKDRAAQQEKPQR